MTRKKVKLVWIANDTARKASFKKRRLGLMKKVRELTTLCGIYAFAVVYGPDDQNPVIWPSLSAAQHLYRRYHSLPLVERQKKTTNQETYLKERTVKAQEQLKKAMKKNQALEMEILMNELQSGRGISELSTADLLGLVWMMEHRMRECRKRMEYHRQVNRLNPAPGFVSCKAPLLQTGGANETDPVRSLVDQWFVDMVMEGDDEIGGGTGCGMARAGMNLDGGVNMGTGEGNNLLPEWNFDGSHSGMTEMERFASSFNENACPVDLSGGGGGIGGSGEAEMLLLSDFLNEEWPNNNITPP